MVASTTSPSAPLDLTTLQAGFLALLPRIERHGRVYFRGVKCPHTKGDFLAEMAALAWRWYVRLAERGTDAARFPSALASYAARAVRSGRRLSGQEKARDVLSARTRQRRGFATSPIPDGSSLNGNAFDEALQDNTRSPVDEQVAFRLDFPAWLQTYDGRKRRVIEDLMVGERTLDVAERHRLSAGRVSQMRREFRQDWEHFCSDPGERLRADSS
jgi:hypothetical protein